MWKRARSDETLRYLRDTAADIPPVADGRLNVANGLLDWRTGELAEHSQFEAGTAQLPVTWRPGADCPNFRRFLSEVVPPDAVGLIEELLGYSILPVKNLRVAFMLLGPGWNGKGTLLRVMGELLGPDNVSHETLQNLAESRFAVANLYGKLANLGGDLDARALRRSDIFKSLTGNDPVSADRKFRDSFSFVNQAVLVFGANEVPATADQTNAYFSRWRIVKFPNTFAEDGHLLGRLTTPEERSGILNLAVAGLRRLTERGRFETPPSVKEAAREYREQADTVAAFVLEKCETGPGRETVRTSLYESYSEFCRAMNKFPVSAGKFYEKMRTDHGCADSKRDGVRTLKGVELSTAGLNRLARMVAEP
jgi:putative DNA primase/helicase